MRTFEIDHKAGAKVEKILINPMHVIYVKSLPNGLTALTMTGGTQINASMPYEVVAEALNAAMG